MEARKLAAREWQRARRERFRATETCVDCMRSLDTPSPYRCRACLDRNRDIARAKRGGVAAPRSCYECYGTGHMPECCPMRGRVA